MKGKYEKELIASIIPFWEKNSIDRREGGYFTFLDRDGSVFDENKFMWMQWRIVYQFASLYNDYKKNSSWLDIAKQGYDFLTVHGHDDETGGDYYFGLNREGDPIVAPYNIFSEAFAMMGAAELFRATQKDKYKKEAVACMDRYISRIGDPKGKWNKMLPAAKARINLGPQMILANMGLILKESLGIDTYSKEVDNAISLVLDHFYSEEHQIIFENINSDYTYDLNSSEGRHLNPGHGLEACWFILNYAEKNNRPDLIKKTCHIIKNQLNFGWDKDYGGIFYFMDVLNKPHQDLSWNMKLWWVHNEALIAVLYAYRLTGDEEFSDWFQRLDEWTWKHFPDREYGEWFGYLNRRGEPTHLLKGGKWKTFFHLPRCLKECTSQMELILKSKK